MGTEAAEICCSWIRQTVQTQVYVTDWNNQNKYIGEYETRGWSI
jgi:hypothetical protein